MGQVVEAYLIRYIDAAVAGITSADAVQGSVDGLADSEASAAHGFSASSDVRAAVAGVGSVAARAKNQNWAEYGLRAGYKIAEGTTVYLFANGVSGNGGIHTENHFSIDLKFDL